MIETMTGWTAQHWIVLWLFALHAGLIAWGAHRILMWAAAWLRGRYASADPDETVLLAEIVERARRMDRRIPDVLTRLVEELEPGQLTIVTAALERSLERDTHTDTWAA